jgi:hypothetical protein
MIGSIEMDVTESTEERRARILRGQLASFENGVRYHFANGPETWHVVKRAERLWYVVNGSGDTVTSETSKRAATELLVGNNLYRRIWIERDEWFRGTSRDPRDRQFTPAELEIIARVIA